MRLCMTRQFQAGKNEKRQAAGEQVKAGGVDDASGASGACYAGVWRRVLAGERRVAVTARKVSDRKRVAVAGAVVKATVVAYNGVWRRFQQDVKDEIIEMQEAPAAVAIVAVEAAEATVALEAAEATTAAMAAAVAPGRGCRSTEEDD